MAGKNCLNGGDHPAEALQFRGVIEKPPPKRNRYHCTLCGKDFTEPVPHGGGRPDMR